MKPTLLRVPVLSAILVLVFVLPSTTNGLTTWYRSIHWSNTRIVDGRGNHLRSVFEGQRSSKMGVGWLATSHRARRPCRAPAPNALERLWSGLRDLFGEQTALACDGSTYVTTIFKANLPSSECPGGEACDNCAPDDAGCSGSDWCTNPGGDQCDGCQSQQQSSPCQGCEGDEPCSSVAQECISCSPTGGDCVGNDDCCGESECSNWFECE